MWKYEVMEGTKNQGDHYTNHHPYEEVKDSDLYGKQSKLFTKMLLYKVIDFPLERGTIWNVVSDFQNYSSWESTCSSDT